METSDLVESIDWAEYERVVVLSPHLDDAALSCFGLLRALDDIVSRLVITICCGDPAPAPFWGKDSEFRQEAEPGDYGSPDERRREDMAAMNAIGCDFVHLGFSDGVYRRSPTSGELIYRTSREKFVQPRIDDAGHIEELFLVLRRLCQNMGRILLISPLAVGYHVDHAITAHVALRLEGEDVDLLFYEDLPYVLGTRYRDGLEDSPEAALERINRRPEHRYAAGVDPAEKARIIEFYASQVPALFGEDADLEGLMGSRTHDGRPSEFYWKA